MTPEQHALLTAVRYADAPYRFHIIDELGRRGHSARPIQGLRLPLIYRLRELEALGMLMRSTKPHGSRGYKWTLTYAGHKAVETVA